MHGLVLLTQAHVVKHTLPMSVMMCHVTTTKASTVVGIFFEVIAHYALSVCLYARVREADAYHTFL